MDQLVKITYQAEWRRALWDADTPSRPAWFVDCPEHPRLGRDSSGEVWGYASSRIAHAVATRHQRAYHRLRVVA